MQINPRREIGAKQEGRKEGNDANTYVPPADSHRHPLSKIPAAGKRPSRFLQDRQGLQGGGAARSPFFRNFGYVEMVEIREKFETEFCQFRESCAQVESLAAM